MSLGHSAGMFRRVVVKLSGEALTGPEVHGLHAPTVARIARRSRERRRRRRRDRCQWSEAAISSAESRRQQGHRARPRRFDRHVGHCHERLGAGGRDRGGRLFGARAVGRPDALRLPAILPPGRLASSRQGPDLRTRRRHRQSFLHDRHRCRSAGCRTLLRCGHESHAGRRRLFGGSETRPGGGSVRTTHPCRSHSKAACHNGHGGVRLGPRKPHSDHRLLHRDRGSDPGRSRRQRHLHHGHAPERGLSGSSGPTRRKRPSASPRRRTFIA